MMIAIKTPEEFTILGIRPFLSLFPSDVENFKKIHLALSRKLHPDSMGSDASAKLRSELEGKMAAVNAAFIKVRELKPRLELVLKALDESEKLGPVSFTPPPALAMEWFELQEELSESRGTPALQKRVETFVQKVQGELSKVNNDIMLITEKYPFIGQGVQEQWSVDAQDAQKLRSLTQNEKYLTNILVASRA